MMTYLEFEKPIEVLDNKIHELKSLNENAPLIVCLQRSKL
tara:strand:+ start:517 stop:636 length:120 start_codon:yes stop_codon:yes gene_type:complete